MKIGLYQIELTVQMKDFDRIQSSAYTFIQIRSSPLFIELGTSFITIGKEQNLLVNPKKYSLSLSEQTFHEDVFDNLSLKMKSICNFF